MIGVVNYDNDDFRFFFEEGDLGELYLWDVKGFLVNYQEQMGCGMITSLDNEFKGDHFSFKFNKRPASLTIGNCLLDYVRRDAFYVVDWGIQKFEFFYAPSLVGGEQDQLIEQYDVLRRFRDECADLITS